MNNTDPSGPIVFDIPDDVLGPQRTLLDTFNLWINPEVHRRAQAGSLKLPISLSCAQVIFRGSKAPEVRLNHEVKGSAEVRTAKAVNAGDPVYLAELLEVQRFELGREDADAGHITLFKMQDGSWHLFFYSVQNKLKAAELVESAKQFTSTAEFASANGHVGPYVDNLFNASDLLARARLITHAHEEEVKKHSTVHSKINQWAKLGNVDKEFVKLFNELAQARDLARYRGGTPVLKSSDPVGIVRAEIASLQQRLDRWSDDKPVSSDVHL